MQGNNWSNYERHNHPRGTSSNSRGNSRLYNNRSNRNWDDSRPTSHVGRGKRQNNAQSGTNSNSGYRGRQGTYPKYFKTKSFPHNRPGPYDRPHHSRHAENFRGHHSYPDSHSTPERELHIPTLIEMTPLEKKIEKLINVVRSQDGIIGQLVFLQAELDSPTTVLQNALQSLRNCALTVRPKESNIFEILINEEKLAEGAFQNRQIAKNVLCETVMNDLRKKCFYIIKKRNYEEVSTEDISKANTEVLPSNSMEGSKAHLMMLKMGWGGKGLGSNEQGSEKTVAETLTQNVTKAGLGDKNVMNEIHGILEKFAASTKVTTLAFDTGFTKEERAHIHSIASKFNLKSKSEGKDDSRRITISKKIAKWDLVRELLLVNCENDSYKLLVPSEFENIWINE